MLYNHLEEDAERLYSLKDYFCEGLRKIPDIRINNPEGMEGAPHIVSLSVAGVRSEVLLHALEDKGIYVSAGSACSSASARCSTAKSPYRRFGNHESD